RLELAVRLADRQAELRFGGGLKSISLLRGSLPHPPQETPGTSLPRLAIEREHVAGKSRAMGRIGQHCEGVEVRDEPNLADRPHAVDGRKVIERAGCHHCNGQPYAVIQ